MAPDRDSPDIGPWAPAREDEEAMEYIGALAASVRALEPDLRILAARVRWALQAFEGRFDADDVFAYERYERDRTATGAGDLYDAVVDLAELLTDCVAGLDGRLRRISTPA